VAAALFDDVAFWRDYIDKKLELDRLAAENGYGDVKQCDGRQIDP
jgi:hypothetical protein